MNPNPDKDEHALALDESSSIPSTRAVHATRELYRLSSASANRIELEVRGAFEDWHAIARAAGIQRREIDLLSTVIDA